MARRDGVVAGLGTMTRPRTVLAIGGSDPSGGAGIQADLKAFHAQGVYGMAVITALTVQNTHGVRGVRLVTEDVIRAQIDAVLDDVPVDAVKIGMLGTRAAVRAVTAALARWTGPLVIDPVGVAKGGWTLQGPATIKALADLATRATLVTPNLLEEWAFPTCPRLVKGGHGEGARLSDVLYLIESGMVLEARRWSHPRIDSLHTHGTGCVLASTLAARLAIGDPLEAACDIAIAYVQRQIRASIGGLGGGNGPLWQVG